MSLRRSPTHQSSSRYAPCFSRGRKTDTASRERKTQRMRRARGKGPGIGSWIAILAWPTSVAASSGNFQLAWSGPPECPASERLRAEVVRILHHPIEARDGASLAIDGRVERKQDARYHLTVDVREEGHTSTRHVDAD